MKLLFLGLAPVLVFFLVESFFGTSWGLLCTIIWALGECIYEYVKFRRIEKVTILSTLLIVIMGGVGAWLDNSSIFKFQPVIMEVGFALVLFGLEGLGHSPLLMMATKMRPEIFRPQDPVVWERQKLAMARLTRAFCIILLFHSLVLSYFAVYGSTASWAFWKGGGLFVFFGAWSAFEFLRVRRLQRLRGRNEVFSNQEKQIQNSRVTMAKSRDGKKT